MIVCAGHAAFDLNLPLGEYPIENRKYMVDQVEESSGGPAANAASLLARWGVPVVLLAPLGDDVYGHRVKSELEADGVCTDLLKFDAFPTPLSVVLANTSSGTRTIVTRRPPRPPLTADLSLCEARGVEGLLFDGHEPELSLELMRRFPHAWSVLDAGTLRAGTELLARKVNYLIASQSFAQALAAREGLVGAEAELDALATLSSGWLAVTRGERGCVWRNPQGLTGEVAALGVKALDTTGAGDLFHGAFVYGLGVGDPQTALVWATVAAGLSVQRRGGRASIPTLDETRAVLRSLSN